MVCNQLLNVLDLNALGLPQPHKISDRHFRQLDSQWRAGQSRVS